MLYSDQVHSALASQLPSGGIGVTIPSAEKAQLFASLGSAFSQGIQSTGGAFPDGWAQALALAQGTGAAAVIRPQARIPTAQQLIELTNRVRTSHRGRSATDFFGGLLTCRKFDVRRHDVTLRHVWAAVIPYL